MADRPQGSDDPSAAPAGFRQGLRKRAESMVRKKAGRPTKTTQALSPKEALRLIHELRVHQIELEMQNEELRRIQLDLEISRKRYFDLYDLAPVGYCTLSEGGLILEANLAMAKLLGVERSSLEKQRLTKFILPEDQDIYYLYRRKLLSPGSDRACELRMLRPDGAPSRSTLPFWARVEAVPAQAPGGPPLFRCAVSDVSEGKQAAERRAVFSRMLEVREEERRRLATVLHEMTGAIGVGLLSSLVLLKEEVREGRPGRAIARATRMQRMVRDLVGGLKEICIEAGVPSLTEIGLGGALSGLSASFRKRSKIRLRYDIDLADGGESVDRQVAFALYRLTQEALRNIVRHSGARSARIAVGYEGEKVRLAVNDDGCGFDAGKPPPRESLGLKLMREEAEAVAGTMTVDSRPQCGTRICVAVPRRLPPHLRFDP